MDWRGQGGSDRLLDNPGKGHVRSFRDYDRDLAQLMTEVVLPQCPPPYIGLGHSLGGHILLRHAPARDSWFQRILVTAPMIELAQERTKMSQGSVRAYTEIFCALGLGRMFVLGGTARPAETGPFEGNFVTGDRERYERARAVLLAAPEISLGSPTVGWLRAACRSMATLQAPDYPRSVRVPTLMVAAGRDQIVSTTRIEAFALRLKLGSHVLIAPSKHEILMESDDIRARFWATFDAYLGVAAVAA